VLTNKDPYATLTPAQLSKVEDVVVEGKGRVR
jgi:hypothetical protein